GRRPGGAARSRPGRVARLAGGAPRHLARRVAGADQEGRHAHHDDLGDRGRRGAVLRLDRRAGPAPRRRDVPPADDTPPAAQHVVGAQCGPHRPAGARGSDDACRPGGRRGRQGGRAVGRGVRPALGGRRARRPARGDRGRPCGAGDVRGADQDQPLRAHPPARAGEAGRDAGAQDRGVRGDAGPPGDRLPAEGAARL
ncbi:MAG: FIG00815799: hypothetical protein, partial [uncultured Nocardioides sp.]